LGLPCTADMTRRQPQDKPSRQETRGRQTSSRARGEADTLPEGAGLSAIVQADTSELKQIRMGTKDWRCEIRDYCM
jgi:hypothetical protein